MGRPNPCDCRCGGDDPPQPPVTDCEDLLCVVFMDENSPGIPDAKMQGFIDAFPNRVLIVLDVHRNNPPYMTYTTKFIDHPRAFSLRLEYESDPTDLINFIERDNGRTSVAITNDPWERIKTILARHGLTDWLNNDNSEVSIFIDDSGSMRVSNVAATVDKLEADLEADGKTRTESIYNGSEDIICPFVVSECCVNQAAEDLAALCGYTWDCPEFANINFVAPTFGYLDYTVKVDGEQYGPGDSIIREVGTLITFELTGTFKFTPCPGATGTSYGPWRGRTPASGVPEEFYGDPNFSDLGATCDQSPLQDKCICTLNYTMPSGGLDIWAPVSCIYE